MNSTRQELGTPTKLVGFVVGIALVFFLALFVGHAIGPDASPSEPKSRPRPTRRMASSMISLAMYSVTTGTNARSRRRPRLASVSGRLVCQIWRRNGPRLRIASKRSRRLGVGLAVLRGEGIGVGLAAAEPRCG